MNYLNLKEASHKDISTAVEMLEKKNVFFLDLNGTVGDSNNTNAENVVTSEMANSIGQLLETRVIVLNSGWDLKGIQARILDKLETIGSINWSNLYIMPSNGSQLLRFNIDSGIPKMQELYKYHFNIDEYNVISELVFECIRIFLNSDLQNYFPQQDTAKIRDLILQNMDGELREGGTQASFFL